MSETQISQIGTVNIAAIETTLTVFETALNALAKDIILQQRSQDGTRRGKDYPPELAPFYQYFRTKVLSLLGDVDRLQASLHEFVQMKEPLELLISFQNSKE